eukprot:15433514-Alexandrium_andersonii.AAC.1
MEKGRDWTQVEQHFKAVRRSKEKGKTLYGWKTRADIADLPSYKNAPEKIDALLQNCKSAPHPNHPNDKEMRLYYVYLESSMALSEEKEKEWGIQMQGEVPRENAEAFMNKLDGDTI